MRILNAYVEGPFVNLLYRSDNDQRLMVKKIPASYVSYFKAGELGELGEAPLRESRFVRSVTREPGDWVRVDWRDYDSRSSACGAGGYFSRSGVNVYEADVNPVRRMLSDYDIEIAKPRRVYIDIETDSRVPFRVKEKARVLSWAAVDTDGRVMSSLLQEDTDEDERRLLQEYWDAMGDYDQIIAWNGDRFDFPVLQHRSSALGVVVKGYKRWLYLDHLVLFKRQNAQSASSGDEKQSYRLEDVAQSILKYGKDDFDSSKTWEAWSAGGAERQRMLEYNIKDTKLLKDIEQKTGYIDLFHTLCEVCRCFPNTRSLNPTVQVDGYMLALGKRRGYHFPTYYYDDVKEPEHFQGAFIMDVAAAGITRNVHVGDFKSLYPSIMVSWNMSPDTKGPILGPGAPPPDGYCCAPGTTFTFSSATEGIISGALKEIMGLRLYWNDRKASFPPGTEEAKDADRRSRAYKVAANSFYGVVGSPFSRYYDRDIAECVTKTGASLIKKTIERAVANGFEVIYANTDSVFIRGLDYDGFKSFVNDCNANLYPAMALETNARENLISLAYETQYERIIFASVNRYVGRFAHYKGVPASADSEPDIKGLEYKRGDILLIGRRLQKRIIDMLCKDCIEDPNIFLELISKAREWVLNATLTADQVRVTKSLTKPISDYTTKDRKDGSAGADLAHVAIAKVLIDRGEDIAEGSKISYIVVDASVSPMVVIPASDYVGECDRFYLWEKLIYPPSLRLLLGAFPASALSFKGMSRVRPKVKIAKEHMRLFCEPEVIPSGELTSLFGTKGKTAVQPAIEQSKAAPTHVIPMRSSKPYSIQLPASFSEVTISAVEQVIAAFPGSRKVTLSTGSSIITCSRTVNVTPAFVDAIKKALLPLAELYFEYEPRQPSCSPCSSCLV